MTLCVAAISAGLALPAFKAMGRTSRWMDGNSWTVTGISIKCGRDIDYTRSLAVTRQKQPEFARAKGWIRDYKVLRNVNPRMDKPDICLIVIGGKLPDGAEMDRRNAEMRAHMAMTEARCQRPPGNTPNIARS